MAVLVEMISVVIRKSSIKKNLSSEHYLNLMDYALYNPSCMDDEVLCIHMNRPILTGEFVDFSKKCNLDWGDDFIIIDQDNGPTTACEWIQVREIGSKWFKEFEEDETITIASFYNGPKNLGDGFYLSDPEKFTVHFPREWEYEGSMSQGHKVIPLEDL